MVSSAITFSPDCFKAYKPRKIRKHPTGFKSGVGKTVVRHVLWGMRVVRLSMTHCLEFSLCNLKRAGYSVSEF
jgi:hypothetical protein